MTAPDSPTELATIIGTLQPIAEGNWRVQKAITILQGMGEPLRHPEGKRNGLTAPANDELIAKLEAIKKPINNDRFDYRYEREHNSVIQEAISIIRAHQPAPVDLEVLKSALQRCIMNAGNGHQVSQTTLCDMAKAVIQALGMTV